MQIRVDREEVDPAPEIPEEHLLQVPTEHSTAGPNVKGASRGSHKLGKSYLSYNEKFRVNEFVIFHFAQKSIFSTGGFLRLEAGGRG